MFFCGTCSVMSEKQRSAELPVVWVLLVCAVSLVYANVEEDEAVCTPQHVHIAYGDALDRMVIVWATRGNCTTLLEFGTSPWQLDQHAAGTSVEFWEQNFRGLHIIHLVELTDLAASATYFYRPISNNIGKGPFYFKTPRTDLGWSPEFLVFGDLGVHTQTIPTLVEEALKGEYTALLHIGDLAYNLKDGDGLIGDQFMQLIEPVAAYLPYMTAPGNHEIDSDTFTHYAHRFSMPQSPWPMSVNKLWYSFDVGPVHFVSYSSEVFFTLEGSLVQKQFDWLVADLKKANAQRNERPWVIAFGHRPMYCSANDGDDCTKNDSLVRTGLEDVFYHFGVDIVLQGHEHNYERLYPVYKGVVVATNYTNPPAPVQIISGAAGSKHGIDRFQPPPQPDWSAVRVDNTSLNSYGRLHVINSTHVYWEQRSIFDGAVLDELWIVQHRHGRFQLDDLPHNVSQEIGQNLVTYGGFLDEEDSEQNKEELVNSDKSRRIAIGVSFAVLFTMLVVVAVVTKACRRKQYTTVRRWEAMDLDYGKKLFTAGKDEDDDLEKDFEIDMGNGNLQSRKLLSVLNNK
ncbi:acid phosphatase type 7-like isoform X2 [Littorina saxatilis]|uniref:acid phosphatase type 7-like isoform X2 n=1 Tax=Littorina saxatilis TaxID=31220 RepID=UPI0038B57B3D